MLLKHRPPGIDSAEVALAPGLEHVEQRAVAVLRWLNANKVDYVVVGPVAHAIRGDLSAKGPVAIVLAPYSRNFDRLTAALVAVRAGLRSDRGTLTGSDKDGAVAIKLTAEKLARGRRWMFRFGSYDLDIEGAGNRAAGARTTTGRGDESEASAPRYQELLYEAGRFELAQGVSVEVASPEDLEHFSHVRRTGSAPEFRISRKGGPTAPPVDDPEASAPEASASEAVPDPEQPRTEPSSPGSADA